MKDFKDVNIGYTAIGYGGEKFKVHDKGTAEEMFKKYDRDSHFGIEDWIDVAPRSSKVIVEKHDPTPLEGTIITIWLYDYDGAYVE